MACVALLPSPLCGPTTWQPVAHELEAAGHAALPLDCGDDGRAPYWRSAADRAARRIDEHGEPVFLVGHSGAGPLLAEIGRRTDRLRGLVFVDAGLPLAGSRLDAMRTEDAEFAGEFAQLLDCGQRYPNWTDAVLRDLIPDEGMRSRFVAELRPRGADFFTERLPDPPPGWDETAAYLLLSPPYESVARRAAELGMPVRAIEDAHHFWMLTEPAQIAEEVLLLLPVIGDRTPRG